VQLKEQREKMSYTKPQIIKLDNAVRAFRGDEKGGIYYENPQSPPNATVSAYEADE
jgi:hypothetical protein